MEKFSEKFYDEADQNVTLRRIRKALQHRLVQQFPDKEPGWIIDRTENILKINGLDLNHFNFVHQAERIITERLNDVSIDDNSNKNEKTMACIFSEISNPIKKAVGFDYLYRVLKELYGKKEAKRLSSLMYDYSIGLSDSSNIMVPYSYYGHTPITIRINESEIKQVTLKKLFEMFEHHSNYINEYNYDEILTKNIQDEVYVSIGTTDGYKKVLTSNNKNKLSQYPQITTKIEVWDTVRGWQNISRIIRHKHDDEKQFVLYQINDGSFAFVTEDHPVILADGSEKLAKDLIEGDEVLKESEELPNVLQNITVPHELAYFTGFLIGDGNYISHDIDYSKMYNTNKTGVAFRNTVHGNNGLTVYQNNIADSYIKKVAEKLFGEKSFFYNKYNAVNEPRAIGISSADYAYLIAGYFGFTYRENSFTKHLPENILSWDNESVESLLAGIIDSDGTVKDNTCSIRIMSMATVNTLYDVIKKIPGIVGVRKRIVYNNEDVTKFIFGLHFRVLPESNLVYKSEKFSKSYKDNPEKFTFNESMVNNSLYGNNIKKIIKFNRSEIDDTRFLKKETEYVYDITTDTGTFYANSMTQHNCFALDASRLVTEGRNFGQLKSRPAKRVSSYISALCETIHQMSSHFAGALAVGTFFFDIAHILLVKQNINIDEYFSDPIKVKTLENEYQQFVHSVNHLSRSGAESPFTNISIFDEVKIRHLISNDLAWYFVNIDTEKVVKTVKLLQDVFIEFFDKGDPLSNGMPYRFPVVTVNFSKIQTEDGWQVEDKKTLEKFCKTDVYRYNIFMSEGTKTASCCFEGNEQIKIVDKDGTEHHLTLKQLFELLHKTDSQIDERFDTGLSIESFVPSENKKEQAKIVGILKKNFTGKMVTLNVNGKSIKVTSDHKFEAKRKSDGEIVEITAIELANNYKDYLLPSL